ncbi:PREDICTED: phospholipase B1, membrane-associated-like isoform X2 [Dufourea novaeangliae]|uniref:phospholipase B1, membrane-associated-like isoform X2 n=1 Tax=Dufourea novaeangliae TaxID=178035 RepID=UPI0007674CD9|nr:PREDICTED: phospholipase B1, membrane-associated-like isoform X2 [Dufourea novaeangliae]
MRKLTLLLILQFCSLLAAQRTELDNPLNLELYRQFRNFIFRTVGGRSSRVPTSVHRLRPGDIDVIAGMGDSLTAGYGMFANSVFELILENRGASASSGGQGTWRTYVTLPNILKEYNPNLIGYAQGTSYTSHSASQLNVAEIGAMSRDMPYMAHYLIDRMKKDPRIDMKNHWKLVSLMIGCNDICSNVCSVPSPWSIVEEHKADIIKTLEILRDNLPRTLVILILPPHLSALVNAQQGRDSLRCYLFTTTACPCLIALQHRPLRQLYYEINRRWQKLEEEVADYPEFHRDDFTVVTLPALTRVTIPLLEDGYADLSYLSYDCFHVSQKTNALYGNSLWNNLVEPYGNKTDHWVSITEKFLCPTPEKPFLMTRENSRRNSEVSP